MLYLRFGLVFWMGEFVIYVFLARVAELVDARDSNSRGFGRVGSSPTSGT